MPLDNIRVEGNVSPTPNQRPTAGRIPTTYKDGARTLTKTPYARTSLVGMPLMKKAQLNGQGWNAIFAPPTFFSPITTPQQWQIASKRREIYQWARHWYENEPKVAAGIDFYCFTPHTPILMEDGSHKAIREIEVGDRVRCHDGTVNYVTRKFERHADENILKIFTGGLLDGPLEVSLGHKLLTRVNDTLKYVQAQELTVGDKVLTPCAYLGDFNDIQKTRDPLAYLLGAYAAEGCSIPYDHVSVRGRAVTGSKGVKFSISTAEEHTFGKAIIDCAHALYGRNRTSVVKVDDNCISIRIYGRQVSDDLVGMCPGTSSDGNKRLAPHVMKWDQTKLLSVVAGYMDGDGCYAEKRGVIGVGVCKALVEQIANIIAGLGIPYSFEEHRPTGFGRQTVRVVRIPRRYAIVFKGVSSKFTGWPDIDSRFVCNITFDRGGKYIERTIRKIDVVRYIGTLHDMEVENHHSYVAKHISSSNSQFPMCGFKLECKNSKIKRVYEKLVKDINLADWLAYISHEYFLIGDVFPMLEITCPSCHGAGFVDGESCEHPDGKFRRLTVLNPDYIEIQKTHLDDRPEVFLIPDEQMKMIVQKRVEPVFSRLAPYIRDCVSRNLPIKLSPRCISHISHNKAPYGLYGSSLLRRLFTTLSYKTKLMTANWIVAERLVLPIRVVKVGDKDRPATGEDIADLQSNLSAVSQDPNLTIVTHHAVEFDWIGACYSKDTQLLTDKGWVNFPDITGTELAGTYNRKTGSIEYQSIQHVTVQDYIASDSQPMIHFKARRVDVCVTATHNMLIERDGKELVVPANQVKHNDKFYSPATHGKTVKFTIRKHNIHHVPYNDKVYCVTVPNGFILTRRNGRIAIHGNTGKIHNIQGELELIGKEILDGFMLNQALLNGEMGHYSCNSSDTKTLCKYGWKDYTEIGPDDEIATFNPDTRLIEYHPYAAKHVYDFDGEMVHFQTDKIDALVTPNHRMWSKKRDGDKFELIRADKVRPRAKVISRVDGFVSDSDDNALINVGGKVFSHIEFAEFIGYYVTEGWVEKKTDRNYVAISQTSAGKVFHQVSNVFASHFDTSTYDGTTHRTRDDELGEYLFEFCGHGAFNKKLPPEVRELSPNNLEVLLWAMIGGDGTQTNGKTDGRKESNFTYTTVSHQLALDFVEVAVKCGFSTSMRVEQPQQNTKGLTNKTGHIIQGVHPQYKICISKGFNGREPALQSKAAETKGKEIIREYYSGKVYCFSVPNELFIVMRNGKVMVTGNSAQVGVEAILHRLESWRNKLAQWVYDHIFEPMARMQGFVDEKATREIQDVTGDEEDVVYLFPKIKWNDMQLRDNSQQMQIFIQLNQEGKISNDTLLKKLDLDWDEEVEKMRNEQATVGAGGAMQQGGAGGAGGASGGTMGLGGGGGGMDPSGGMGGGAPGGDAGAAMGGGAPMGGAPGGGAPMGGGGAGMGAAAGTMPGQTLPKIGKRGSKKDQEETAQPQVSTVRFTKLEAKVWRAIEQLQIPQQFPLYAQFEVPVVGNPQPYRMDFAYPKLKVDIECLHPEQEIRTRLGMKEAQNVSVGDQLLGRDGSYVDVKQIFRNSASDDLRQIKALGCLPIDVTGNHPLLVSKPIQVRVHRDEPSKSRTLEHIVPQEPSWVKAEDVQLGDFLLLPKKTVAELNTLDLSEYNAKNSSWRSKALPSSLLLDHEMGRLFGLYIAEGSTTGSNIAFSFHEEETDFIGEVQRILTTRFSTVSEVHVNKEEHSARVTACHLALGKFFSTCGCIAYEKRLPEFVFDAPADFVSGLLSGLIDGDGCRAEGRKDRIVSSSTGLLLDIQRLLASKGQFGNISMSRAPGTTCVIQGRAYITKGLWELSFCDDCTIKPHYREDNDFFYVPVKEITSLDSVPFTINFETLGDGKADHTFLVSNLVTHNCDGQIWHENESESDDAVRDQKLASLGWRVLRFKEDAINEHIDEVKKIIYANVYEAHEESTSHKKTASADGIPVELGYSEVLTEEGYLMGIIIKEI